MFTGDLSFLDDHKNDKSVNSKDKDLHRIDINRAEEIRDDDGKSKYNRTMNIPFDSTTSKIDSTTMNTPVDSTTKADKFTTIEPTEKSTTEFVVTTPKVSTTTVETSTSNIPLDSTTPKTPNTSAKTPKIIPAEPNSHFIKWFFGKFVVVIFILTFQQKFVTKNIDYNFFLF